MSQYAAEKQMGAAAVFSLQGGSGKEKSMRYNFHIYDKQLARMRKMVQKLYPEFHEDHDYCLWLVFDHFEAVRFDLTAHEAVVKIKDKEGKEIQYLPGKTSLLVRKPYPNKAISQIGVKNGAKRIFGIPIVTHDLETLRKIQTVSITWFCLYPTHMDSKRSARAKVILSDFILNWGEASENTGHWFTIARKENSRDYDFAQMEVGNRYENGRVSPGVITDPLLARLALITPRELEPKLNSIIEKYRQIPAWKELSGILDDPIELTFCFNKIELAMEPCPYADLLPESCFGF